ncbi:hypothetical protein QTI17_27590 [Variovorax sp. J31P179]|jgi:signal transduction histidine kinase|uniref:hypothetical protein n=1 Tax=Variovorax sp. J31P179 TaxID=3053508 RepID=UPI002574C186|nr:hypothetical protein [Variovorax sp. J31P179]MDM0084370.1 hypothetical protein [Variovorax sp. J31P179]
MKHRYLLGAVVAVALLGMGLSRPRSGPRETAEALRERSRAQLADAAARLARFDHDLRTPVGTLMSAVSLLEAAPDDAALRAEALGLFSRQLARLTGLADDLHDLALELHPAARHAPAEAKQIPWDTR